MSNPNNSANRFEAPLILLTWLLYAAVAVIPLLVIWRLRMALAPFLIALALALLIDPAIKRLEKHGIARRWSVFIISLVFLGVFALVAVYLIPMLAKQIIALPGAVKKLPDVFSTYSGRLDLFITRLHVPDSVLQEFYKASERALKELPRTLTTVGTSLAKSAGYIIWLVLIPIATIYLLGDLDRIGKKAVYLIPRKHRQHVSELASEIGQVFLAWARGMAIVSIGNGVLIGIGLALLGVPYALVLGIVAVLLYPVPYVGPWLTAGACFVTALVSVGIVKAGISVGIMLGFNFMFDNLITPRIVGGKVGLHPVVSLIALMVGANLFGIIGMLLALPAAATIQILLIHAMPKLSEGTGEEQK